MVVYKKAKHKKAKSYCYALRNDAWMNWHNSTSLISKDMFTDNEF